MDNRSAATASLQIQHDELIVKIKEQAAMMSEAQNAKEQLEQRTLLLRVQYKESASQSQRTSIEKKLKIIFAEIAAHDRTIVAKNTRIRMLRALCNNYEDMIQQASVAVEIETATAETEQFRRLVKTDPKRITNLAATLQANALQTRDTTDTISLTTADLTKSMQRDTSMPLDELESDHVMDFLNDPSCDYDAVEIRSSPETELTPPSQTVKDEKTSLIPSLIYAEYV